MTNTICFPWVGYLSGAIPELSLGAFKTLISRAEKQGLLKRICHGLYLYPKVNYPKGLTLYHAAARLRADEFNYISLESALSDAGVISQIPINWITLMSSGRSHIVNCADFGHIAEAIDVDRGDALAIHSAAGVLAGRGPRDMVGDELRAF